MLERWSRSPQATKHSANQDPPLLISPACQTLSSIVSTGSLCTVAIGHNCYCSTEKPHCSSKHRQKKGASVCLPKCPWWEETFVTLSTDASLFDNLFSPRLHVRGFTSQNACLETTRGPFFCALISLLLFIKLLIPDAAGSRIMSRRWCSSVHRSIVQDHRYLIM